eukprot:4075115-Prymnesium_polylepis.1
MAHAHARLLRSPDRLRASSPAHGRLHRRRRRRLAAASPRRAAQARRRARSRHRRAAAGATLLSGTVVDALRAA